MHLYHYNSIIFPLCFRNLVDRPHDNMLDVGEFTMAMHLIQRQMLGSKLPRTLPACLSPQVREEVRPDPMTNTEYIAFRKLFEYLGGTSQRSLAGKFWQEKLYLFGNYHVILSKKNCSNQCYIILISAHNYNWLLWSVVFCQNNLTTRGHTPSVPIMLPPGGRFLCKILKLKYPMLFLIFHIGEMLFWKMFINFFFLRMGFCRKCMKNMTSHGHGPNTGSRPLSLHIYTKKKVAHPLVCLKLLNSQMCCCIIIMQVIYEIIVYILTMETGIWRVAFAAKQFKKYPVFFKVVIWYFMGKK